MEGTRTCVTWRCETLFFCVQGRLETVVDRNLIAGNEFVGFVGHADDLLEFFEDFGSHAFGKGGGGVGSDAVVAIVGDADGDVEEFLGEWIDCAGSHNGFEGFPGALEEDGIVSDGAPEIVDVVGFASGHDVVVDGFHFGAGVLVIDETKSGHENSPSIRGMSAEEMLAGIVVRCQEGSHSNQKMCFSLEKKL
jgi:hypothetical protein